MHALTLLSISCICCLLGFLNLSSSNAYTNTWQTEEDGVINFPRQLPSAGKQFLRWEKFEDDEGRHHRLLLSCPSGYAFDARQMKCTRSEESGRQARQIESCPPDVIGPWPYYPDCSRFINCWQGVGLLMRCDQGLVFDNSSKRCNWPELAGCCEYWENK